MAEWRAYEKRYGPILLHERMDWVIYLLVVIAKALGVKKVDLPPWLQEEPDGDAMLATLYRLAERQKGGA